MQASQGETAAATNADATALFDFNRLHMVQAPFSIPDLSDPQLVDGVMPAVGWLVGFMAVIASGLIFWGLCTRCCKPAWD